MIDIVIPFWNNVGLTKQCVQSILDNTQGVYYRIILVDDGSTENTTEFFEWCATKNNIITAKFEHRGYVYTVNAGLQMSNAEYVLILNNDTTVSDPKWLLKMKSHFREKTGAVGATSNFVAGRQQVRFNDGRNEERTNLLIGFCILIKREVIDNIGLLDEKFNDFAADDVDYSIRMKDAGYEMVIARDVYIHHIGEMSQRNKEEWKKDRNAYYQKGLATLNEKHGVDKVNAIMLETPRLLIGIPTWGQVDGAFLANFFGLQKPLGTECFVSTRTVVHLSRNMIIQEFLRRNAEYLLFLDDDMILPPDTIKRLLAYNKDIVCAMAFRRKEPFQPCSFTFNRDTRMYQSIEPKQGMKKIHGAGSACILIHRRVLEKLTDPWFEYKEAFGQENNIYSWGEFGEDLMFCRKAIEAGFEIWCDTDLVCGHIGLPPIIDEKDYFSYKKKKEEEAKQNATKTIC